MSTLAAEPLANYCLRAVSYKPRRLQLSLVFASVLATSLFAYILYVVPCSTPVCRFQLAALLALLYFGLNAPHSSYERSEWAGRRFRLLVYHTIGTFFSFSAVAAAVGALQDNKLLA